MVSSQSDEVEAASNIDSGLLEKAGGLFDADVYFLKRRNTSP